MKLRTKLLLAPTLTGAVLCATLGTAIAVFIAQDTASDALNRTVISAFSQVRHLRASLVDAHVQLYRSVSSAAALDRVALQGVRTHVETRLDELIKEATARAEKADLAGVPEALRNYQKAAGSVIDASAADAATTPAALGLADAGFNAAYAAFDAVQLRVAERAAAASEALATAAGQYCMALAALGVLATLGALVFSWVTQRRIAADIGTAAQVVAKVSQGRLEVPPPSTSSDEVGQLLRSLAGMVTQLRGSIQTVQNATDSISTASREIATGNEDLSARTDQTATSLQQAAASMEQLTVTVRQSADSARQANALASSAAEVAARGGVVVSQVVATMDDINTSSKRIADIIGVIDGIAFQTNILALNAAVEAARAGEQGRGFAVVASEVRSLAQRSAQAAKEIKGLIGSSVEKVEGGSRLVADAGRTMNEIVGSVQRVSDMIGEITASALEQSEGIGQISGSVNELDRMTQQNAALVEESAAAAQSLQEQASRLSHVVGMFRLDGSDAPAHALPATHALATRAAPDAARAAFQPA